MAERNNGHFRQRRFKSFEGSNDTVPAVGTVLSCRGFTAQRPFPGMTRGHLSEHQELHENQKDLDVLVAVRRIVSFDARVSNPRPTRETGPRLPCV